jgi:hypothetical protein
MARQLKIALTQISEGFDAAMREKYRPLAEAGQETIQEVSDRIKTAGRAHIAGAGFSIRWQNALRGEVYPKRKSSLNAAVLIYHKIPYADIFESGGTIRGKPTMFVPLSTTPRKLKGKALTADRYRREVGPLTLINRPGKKPILAAQMAVSERQARRGETGKVTVPKLRKGAAQSGIVRAVPLFVGVDSVTLKKRLSLTEVIDGEVNAIERIFTEKVSKKDL